MTILISTTTTTAATTVQIYNYCYTSQHYFWTTTSSLLLLVLSSSVSKLANIVAPGSCCRWQARANTSHELPTQTDGPPTGSSTFWLRPRALGGLSRTGKERNKRQELHRQLEDVSCTTEQLSAINRQYRMNDSTERLLNDYSTPKAHGSKTRTSTRAGSQSKGSNWVKNYSDGRIPKESN